MKQANYRRNVFLGITVLLLLGVWIVVPGHLWAGEAEQIRIAYNVKIPMRDGVLLSADIYFPAKSGKLPAILARSPYDNSWRADYWFVKREYGFEAGTWWAKRGYVFVSQDCRGRYDSDGDWDPFFDDPDDGRDTLKWIVSQPWSNGKVGTIGLSYGGWVQWLAAPDAGDTLTAMVPEGPPPNPFLNVPYTNGALVLGMSEWALLMDGRTNQDFGGKDPVQPTKVTDELYRLDKNVWHLPVIDVVEQAGRNIPWWREWVQHNTYDDYWKRLGYQGEYGRISAPALNITGWYDVQLLGPIMNYVGMRKQGKTPESRKQMLLIGPWGHLPNHPIKTRDFGDGTVIDLDSIILRWFDYWLKGEQTGILNEPPILLFVMGRNQWQQEREWPLARTQWTTYYLHSQGQANSVGGDGELSQEKPGAEPPDRYDYDPANPVMNVASDPTGGMGRESLIFPDYIQHLHRRGDVLVYETPPLEEDVEIIGPVTLKLYAASSAPDTDWVARLSDVSPDGQAWSLCGTIMRARYRESLEAPTLLELGRVYEYTLEFWPTANRFFRGHRIRLDITSSAFPTFDRNLNTGEHNGTSTRMEVAHQTIYHDEQRPSHVILPLIPIQ